MGSTISGTVTTTVTIGSSAYSSPLTVTSAGYVIPAGAMNVAPGIYVPTSATNAYLLNQGVVDGGSYGGIGILFNGTGTLINDYLIFGQNSDGYGGAGVFIGVGTSLTNFGDITGGNGTNLQGGAGVTTSSGLINDGVIRGGSSEETSGTGVAGSGTFINQGQIDGGANSEQQPGGTGVSLQASSSFLNSGTITGGSGGLGGGYGVIFGAGSTFTNTGTISGGEGSEFSGTGVLLNGGVLIDAGTISAGDHDRPSGTDTFAVKFGDQAPATLVVESGAVFIGTVAATTNLVMDTLELSGTSTTALSGIGTQIVNFATIDFADDAAWKIQGDSLGLANGVIISGFTLGDTIDLDGFTAKSNSYVSNIGLVLSNGATSETLDITGNFGSDSFVISSISTGTEIVICYLRGTKIRTPEGEVNIEALNIGDPVITRFQGVQNIKWVGRQSFSARFVQNNRDKIPVKIAAGALGHKIPARDLFVSPGHSMLLDKTLVLAKSLVNGITITQTVIPEDIHYYLIEFESHDCVFANGAWSESFADGPDLRGQFHNHAAFYKLYPDHRTPESLNLCARRPEFGPELDAALRPVAARAAAITTPGRLHGSIDIIGARIEGWAQDIANPELPVLLEILINGHVIGNILACDYRADLAAAGIGNGRCHFSFAVPGKISTKALHTLRIRRMIDHQEIPPSVGFADSERSTRRSLRD